MKDMSKNEFNKAILGDYTKSPNDIIVKNIYELSDFEKFLFITMLKFTNKGKGYHLLNMKKISYMVYSEYTETSRKALSKSLQSLKSKNLIKTETKYSYSYKHDIPLPEVIYSINKSMVSGDWGKTPNSLLISKKFTWKEKLFAIQIYQLIYADSLKIKLTNTEIGKKLNISRQRVTRLLNVFIEKGVFIRKDSYLEVNPFTLFDISNEVEEEMVQTIFELRNKVEKYETKLNETIKENKELKARIKEYENTLHSDEEYPEDEINQPYLN